MGTAEKSMSIIKDVLSTTATTLGKLNGRVIGNPYRFTEVMARTISRKIGETILYKDTFGSDLNCIRNPYTRRYENPENIGGNYKFSLPDSPLIGQLYDVYYHENDKIKFLDEKAGSDLLGYTHLQEAAEERNENYLLDKLFSVSTFTPFINPNASLMDLPFWTNINELPKRYSPSDPYGIDKLNTIPTSIAPNGRVQIFNNYFEIYTTEANPLTSGPININVKDYGESTYRNGRSTVYSEGGNYSTEDVDVLDKVPSGTNDNSVKGLLYKTNKLFAEEKAKTLISRFYTNTVEDESITQTAIGKNGLSRGRNIGTNNERIWTATKQYSKYNDTIRPFSKEPSKGREIYTKGEGFRPFEGNSRLKEMSVLGAYNNQPKVRIAPTENNADIKRCMFSIENLAWKDINQNIKITTSGGTVLGQILTKEQQGPNGGRIMWFPPYNLSFSEQINTQWNDNTFIGRGEKLYTYSNTERKGNLSFTLLVDHPMIINQMINNGEKEEADKEILRYFAGIDGLNLDTEKVETVRVPKIKKESAEPSKEPSLSDAAQEINFKSFFFFPLNYSGEEYDADNALDIIFNRGARNGSIVGYEVKEENNPTTGLTYEKGYKNQTWDNFAWLISGNTKDEKKQAWFYPIDGKKAEEKLGVNNRIDKTSYGLNDEIIPEFDLTKEVLLGLSASTSSSLWESNKTLKKITKILSSEITDTEIEYGRIISAKKIYEGELTTILDKINEYAPNNKYTIEISVNGYASTDGDKKKNLKLAEQRANIIVGWFKTNYGNDENIIIHSHIGCGELVKSNEGISGLEDKISRCAAVTISLIPKEEDANPSLEGTTSTQKNEVNIAEETNNNEASTTYTEENIISTYDNEYRYFKDIESADSVVYKNIIDKVKHFDPAFHSITPEGFNARLTFLQQCTRQGPTSAASDSEKRNGGTGAGNLAFGRAPFCILRIGDFYNTKICIDNIGIEYAHDNGVSWDLNPEGIGVQPLMATINMAFTFIGGSDLSGPIDRLQNAISHNFYANTSVYDRRADYRDNSVTRENNDSNIWTTTVNENNTTEHIRYSSKNK